MAKFRVRADLCDRPLTWGRMVGVSQVLLWDFACIVFVGIV